MGALLITQNPGLIVEYLWLTSEGDRHTETSLADHGGKGLFVRAIEQALLKGDADLAVHSLKDLPARPVGNSRKLVLAAIPPRADPADCLIARGGHTMLHELPHGAVLGTASPRRASQLRRIRPDLHLELIRGNIDTRLQKVLTGAASPSGLRHYDATLLAVAGLQRAGLVAHSRCAVDMNLVLPAAGQGALALQCRRDDHDTLWRCASLNDPITAAAVQAERQIVAGLAGDCHAPIAVLAQPSERGYRLRARVLSHDGTQMVEADVQCPAKGLGRCAKAVLKDLLSRGAMTVMQS